MSELRGSRLRCARCSAPAEFRCDRKGNFFQLLSARDVRFYDVLRIRFDDRHSPTFVVTNITANPGGLRSAAGTILRFELQVIDGQRLPLPTLQRMIRAYQMRHAEAPLDILRDGVCGEPCCYNCCCERADGVHYCFDHGSGVPAFARTTHAVDPLLSDQGTRVRRRRQYAR